MKQIETDQIGARILEMVTTEGRGNLDDLKSVVRMAAKLRKAVGEARAAVNNALAIGPGEARDKIVAGLDASPAVLQLEDADFEFAQRRFKGNPNWPDGWARFVLDLGQSLEAATDVALEG